jgi:hypothetical protein
VLVLIVSIVSGILLILLIFGLSYVRMGANYQEQRTAIDAASLAAAKDLSRLVIEDPNFGFVSLSDYAPTGKNTIAGDKYFLSVQSINTILATNRLDMIIADQLNNDIMRTFARIDYQNAMQARSSLQDAISAAAAPNGRGYDIDGNVVNPTTDAIAAYNSNAVRLANASSELIPGSLKLTLGYGSDLSTNTVTPQPTSTSKVDWTQQKNGYYLPDLNVPYDGHDFVFAAAGQDTKLVDFKLFATNPKSKLPYSFPTVLKCEADHKFVGSNARGQAGTYTIHAVSCALPGTLVDPRPAPGAFTVSFPGGLPPGLIHFGDLFTNAQIATAPVDALETPPSGDYPASLLVSMSMPNSNIADPQHPPVGHVLSLAYYNWLKRAGATVNVATVMDMMRQSFDNSLGATPQTHEYQMNPEGNLTYFVVAGIGSNMPVSQKQWRAPSGFAYDLGTKAGVPNFDLQLTDYVYQEGRLLGGLHAGEPLDGQSTTSANAPPVSNSSGSYYENPVLPYSTFLIGPPTGAERPTYRATGIAVDVTLRPRS